MSRIIDSLIKYGLMLMVVLSLFLSYKIWTNPSNLSNDTSNKKNSEVIQRKAKKDVFLPTQLILHSFENDRLMTSRERLIRLLLNQIASFDYQEVKSSSMSMEEISELQGKKHQAIELVFPDILPLSFFLASFQFDRSLVKQIDQDQLFDTILLDFEKPAIYYLDRQNGGGYELLFDAQPMKEIKQLILDSDTAFRPVELNETYLTHRYFFNDDVELKKYSYISTAQPFTLFSKTLFARSNDLFAKEKSKGVDLSNSEGENLSIDSRTGNIIFRGKLQTLVGNQNNVFGQSFHYIEQIGSALGNLRYFNYYNKGVNYRYFVEGFPVFGDASRGAFTFSKKYQNIQIDTNEVTLQIPIPSDDTVMLLSNRAALEELSAIGFDVTKLQDMCIGYTWQTAEKNEQIIDLVPEWYGQVNDRWFSFEELKQRFLQGEEEFDGL